MLPSPGLALPVGLVAKHGEDEVSPHLRWTVPSRERGRNGGADHGFTNLSNQR